MKLALVHDWLTGMRGGEKVLEAIAELYPDAMLHSLLHVRGTVSKTLEGLRERRSFVQWLPSSARHYRQYLPVFPTAIEQFDLDSYDLVISTSHCAAAITAATARSVPRRKPVMPRSYRKNSAIAARRMGSKHAPDQAM